MNLTRLGIAAVTGILALTITAHAQNYPTKTIRMIIPFAAGGNTDIIGRIFAPKMAEIIGQQIIIDNRGGAGSVIGTEAVMRAAPDGYTLLMASAAHTINPAMIKKLPYDSVRDFTPIGIVADVPTAFVIHPSLPSKNLKEFIALAKARPGEINFASSGIGTASHLSAEYLSNVAKISMTHVPYKGTGNAMADLLAGQVVLMFDQPVSSMPHVKAGKLRVLGITSGKRFSTMPDIPTVAEQGLPGFESVSWSGVCAPGATPKPVIARLQTEVAKVLKMPDIRDRLLRDGIEPIGGTPEEFQAHIKREMQKWGKVVRDAKVTVQ